MFENFNLTSEVKFDLGGQSSFWSKVAYLGHKLSCKVSLQYFERFLSYELCSPRNQLHYFTLSLFHAFTLSLFHPYGHQR